ncbi:cutinase family protein [Corynebacterium heidelbergense]|uniref:Carbohydrate esterase n=1 Tax=Corynebacterium heidelbergense TaxID=2055947 RepID=A0A364V7F0_9CORY|nr:cutinase family protein [Corynebacterium heidelbergense]RAV32496.1 carbohydrate esterase [Corynebacterium heidelbergense]
MKKLLTVLAVVFVVLVILAGAVHWASTRNEQPAPPGGQPAPPGGQAAPANPPGCVDYEVVAIPGTWESRADDDPNAPKANPNSLMLGITGPLQAEVPADRVKVWTVPYTAQFRNFNAQQEKTYDESREEGLQKASAELQATHQACPGTKFVLMGFSQGAVIAGDLSSNIGNGRGPVPAGSVAGVSLIADGRQELTKGKLIGKQGINGVGAEIALAPVSGLIKGIIPGATMRGPRPDGFGELNDRVNNFCAPADLVCDAPRDVGNALQRAQDLVGANAVHAQYATNGTVVDGQTVPQYVLGWARDLVNRPLR